MLRIHRAFRDKNMIGDNCRCIAMPGCLCLLAWAGHSTDWVMMSALFSHAVSIRESHWSRPTASIASQSGAYIQSDKENY